MLDRLSSNTGKAIYFGLFFLFILSGVLNFTPQHFPITAGFIFTGVILAYTIYYGSIYGIIILASQALILYFSGTPSDNLAQLVMAGTIMLIEGWLFNRFKCSQLVTTLPSVLVLFALSLFLFLPVIIGWDAMVYQGSNIADFFTRDYEMWVGNTVGQVLIVPFLLGIFAHFGHVKRMDRADFKESFLWAVITGVATIALFVMADKFVPRGYKILALCLLFPYCLSLALRKKFFVIVSVLVVCGATSLFLAKGYSGINLSALFLGPIQLYLFLLGLVFTTYLVGVFSHKESELKDKLFAEEQRYRLLFQSMSHAFVFGVIETDKKGNPVDFTINLLNESFAELIGTRHESAAGKKLKELLPSAGQEVLLKYYKVATTGEPYHGEYYSEVFEKHIKVTAYSPETGYAAVIIEDISDRFKAQAELERREQEFRSVFFGSNIGVCLVDLNGNFKLVNRQMEVITGYAKKELEGMDGQAITYSSDRDVSAIFLRNALENNQGQSHFEKRYIHNSGEVVYCLISLSLIRDTQHKPLYFIAHVQDITVNKKQEEEILRSNDKLSRLNSLKDRFFSIIGHDLRNPVGAMKSLSQLLKLELSATGLTEANELVDLMHKQSEETYKLLVDLLEWAQIQTRETEFILEEIDLASLLEMEFASYDPIAENKGIQLKYTVDSTLKVNADPNMLRTILRNLITNAVKFSHAGDVVEISVSEQFDELLFSVQDSGVGMPDHIVESLFKSHRRISTPGTANESGTGFGLSVCKEFVELHHGRIWAESKEGEGSKFCFTIPSSVTEFSLHKTVSN